MVANPPVPEHSRARYHEGVDDATLVAGLRAGDDAAFEWLVRSQTGSLLAVLRRYLRDDAEAQDAVQDAFIAAFRSIDRFEGASKLSTWLHRIAINQALMRLRSRRRRPEDPIDGLLPRFREDGHQAEPALPWPGEGADELLVKAELRERVRAAIDRLPETYRTVLLLRDIEGLSGEEAAVALGVTSTAVKVRLHRARQALRGLLDEPIRGGVTR
ncbi:MAG: sigma-70 family RNA polymerase sigma factor [Acidobacteria bacterium]|nr:sigma-70 family RNA polymerase sigma factor [Acidobacteriota bacterium]